MQPASFQDRPWAQALFQGRQPHRPDRREARCRLSPDSGDAVAQVQRFSSRAGSFRRQAPVILLHQALGQDPAPIQDRRRVPPLLPGQLPQSRAAQAHGKNSPLMGVDPAGGRQHGLLSQLSLPPQGGEELLRSQSPPHSLPDTPFKVGKQDRRAVQKGKDVHIPVAAAVFPVHQPRLRRHADLVQQAPAGQSGHSLGILSAKAWRSMVSVFCRSS